LVESQHPKRSLTQQRFRSTTLAVCWIWAESEDASFSELVEDFGSSSPTESTTHGLLRDKLDSLLKTLTYREREIIRLRYGLTDGYTYTLEEVGRIFRVTRERVRQIEAKAVKKLQHPVRAKQLENFLSNAVN
jgi:RNA polymerase primary sigma factor